MVPLLRLTLREQGEAQSFPGPFLSMSGWEHGIQMTDEKDLVCVSEANFVDVMKTVELKTG